MQYIDCKKYAQEILDEVKAIPDKKKLVIISVGEDEASKVYVKGKLKDAEYCGIPTEHIQIKDTIFSNLRLMEAIQENNDDDDVAGIIVQLPLPKHYGDINYCDLIVPWKDVDGLSSDSYFEPCTPLGIMYLLEKEIGDLTGKNALVIGRSELVGKPLAKMLLDKDCTVTVAHSKTQVENLHHHLLYADIIISAVGKPNLIDLKMCEFSDIVVDVGINRDEDGNLCGDCYNFKINHLSVLQEHTKVTPVPGGVGLLTRAMLMRNVALASEERY